MKSRLRIFKNNEDTKTLYFDSKKDARLYASKLLSETHMTEKVKTGLEVHIVTGNYDELRTNP
jgi:general stress protein 26